MHQITERLIQARGGERGSGIKVSTENMRKHSPCVGAKKGGKGNQGTLSYAVGRLRELSSSPASITDLRKLIQHLDSSISPP